MKKGLVVALAAVMISGCAFGSGCTKSINVDELTVYMPDGAPALALAQLMKEDKENDGFRYYVVSASSIASTVTYMDKSKNADLCVMPVTAACKLLGKGDDYVMVGVVTHGNLYLVSKNQTTIDETNISTLAGKNIGVLNINEVPGMTFKTVLNKYEVAWSAVENDGVLSESSVNLTAISGADAVGTVKGAEYYLLAEPAASAQAKKGYSIVGDVQALYGGENGYPQAVLVAKSSAVAAREKDIIEFVGRVAASANYLKTATGEELVETVSSHMKDKNQATSLKAPMLTTEVLARCGVYFTPAADCATDVKEYLQGVLAVNSNATAMPEEKFFWTYKR